MFDEISWETLCFFLFVFGIFLIQLLLCFKLKSLWIRILPPVLFAVLTVFLAILTYSAEGWDGIGYLILAMVAGGLLLVCGIAWGVWALIYWIRKRHTQKARPT